MREAGGGARSICVPALLICTALFMPTVSAEPWIRDVRESNHPILNGVRSCALEFQPPGTADQEKAESLYLRFIKENPDSELVPYIYYRLGHLFSSRVTPPHERAGAVRDEKKARRYFQAAVKHYPKDRLGGVLLDCQVNVAALAPSPKEGVGEYIAYYKRLGEIEALSSEEVLGRLWFSSREIEIAKVKEDYTDKAIRGFQKELPGRKGIAAVNMVAVASQSQPEMRSELLRQILETFPEDEPGKLARKNRRDSAQLQQEGALEGDD